MESFPAVLAQLETTPQPRPQAPGPRALHRRHDRPAAMGRIDLARPSDEVCAWSARWTMAATGTR
jgi:hypothetical protein